MSYLSLLILLLELCAALTASFYWKKYNGTKERYFVYFLWITLLVEVSGSILGRGYAINTYPLYNIYMVASFLFYFYWYHSILIRRGLRDIIIFFALVFTVIALWSMFTQSWSEYHKYTFVSGAMFTLVCTIFHFWQLLYNDEVLVIRHKLSFWISTGLLLFYMGMIPFMLLSNYFDFVSSLYYIVTIISLNVILYGCYTLGFLWTKEKYNRS